MKNIFAVSLLSLASIGMIFGAQPAKAQIDIIEKFKQENFEEDRDFSEWYKLHNYEPPKEKVKYCYPVSHQLVNENPAYHPNAYEDGYRQGKKNALKGKPYKPRTAGGEFGRGFDDGYFGRDFIGQKRTIPNEVSNFMTMQCNEHSY